MRIAPRSLVPVTVLAALTPLAGLLGTAQPASHPATVTAAPPVLATVTASAAAAAAAAATATAAAAAAATATASASASVKHAPTFVTSPRPRHVAPTQVAPTHVTVVPGIQAQTNGPTRITPRATRTRAVQPTGGDDYPYRTVAGNDPWGFTMRQCVSFAAWRLAQQGRPLRIADGWGSALHWDEVAAARGARVGARAVVGAVAQWGAGESSSFYAHGSTTPNGTFSAGGDGHVGWVKAVYADGSALVEQYNLGGDRSYSVMRVKAPRYLSL